MILQLNENDYRSSEGLSNSFLLRFRKNPATAFLQKKPSESMIFGSAFHSMILEPSEFEKTYFFGDFDLRTKAGKELAEKNADKICLKTTKLYDLNSMKVNLLKFKVFSDTMIIDLVNNEKSLKESCFFWHDKDFPALKKKAKLDLISFLDDQIFIFDIKTTDDASLFEKSIQNYQYYRQAAWYMEAVSTEFDNNNVRFIFLAVETSAPYGVKAYELNNAYIKHANIEAYCDLLNYQNWLDRGSDINEVYPEGITEVKKPEWL